MKYDASSRWADHQMAEDGQTDGERGEHQLARGAMTGTTVAVVADRGSGSASAARSPTATPNR